jgi:hypothetical protein
LGEELLLLSQVLSKGQWGSVYQGEIKMKTFKVVISREYIHKATVYVDAEDWNTAHDTAMDMISDTSLALDRPVIGSDHAQVLGEVHGGSKL